MPDEINANLLALRAQLTDIRAGIGECNERLASVESYQRASAENVRVFWSTHWPQLVERVERLEGKALSTPSAPARPRSRSGASKHVALIAAAIGSAIAAVFEAFKHFGGPSK